MIRISILVQIGQKSGFTPLSCAFYTFILRNEKYWVNMFIRNNFSLCESNILLVLVAANIPLVQHPVFESGSKFLGKNASSGCVLALYNNLITLVQECFNPLMEAFKLLASIPNALISKI